MTRKRVQPYLCSSHPRRFEAVFESWLCDREKAGLTTCFESPAEKFIAPHREKKLRFSFRLTDKGIKNRLVSSELRNRNYVLLK